MPSREPEACDECRVRCDARLPELLVLAQLVAAAAPLCWLEKLQVRPMQKFAKLRDIWLLLFLRLDSDSQKFCSIYTLTVEGVRHLTRLMKRDLEHFLVGR